MTGPDQQPGAEPSAAEVQVADLMQQLDELERTVDTQDERREVRQAKLLASDLAENGLFGENIRKYTTRDMAEAFVGAVLFAVPLVVEDGVFDIADHVTTTTLHGVPVFFAGNVVGICLLAYGLIYWADLQQVEVTRPLFGVVPRRLVGVLAISFLTVLAMMTLWGRLGDWVDPGVALARITVVWTSAVLGAGLGDILPGESEGQDINDILSNP